MMEKEKKKGEEDISARGKASARKKGRSAQSSGRIAGCNGQKGAIRGNREPES